MANPDPRGRHPLDKRALPLDLPVAGGAGFAPIMGALAHVAGSART